MFVLSLLEIVFPIVLIALGILAIIFFIFYFTPSKIKNTNVKTNSSPIDNKTIFSCDEPTERVKTEVDQEYNKPILTSIKLTKKIETNYTAFYLHSNHNIKFSWIVYNGDYVVEGQPIATLSSDYFFDSQLLIPGFAIEKSIKLLSPINGVFHIFKWGIQIEKEIEYKFFGLFASKEEREQEEEREKIEENEKRDKVIEHDTDYTFSSNVAPEKFRNHAFYIDFWYKLDGDYVKKDGQVCRLQMKGEYYGSAILEAPQDGFLEVVKNPDDSINKDYLSDGEILFRIHKTINESKAEELKAKKFKNKAIVSVDEFSGNKDIKWMFVDGQIPRTSYSSDVPDSIKLIEKQKFYSLFLTVNYTQQKDYLIIQYPTKDYKLSIGSTISFHFSNGEIVRLNVVSKPFKSLESYSYGHIFETKIPLTITEIEAFCNREITQWQIEISKSGQQFVGILDTKTKSSIKSLFKDYCEIVKNEIPNYKPLETKEEDLLPKLRENEYCYVYLMKDLTNNFHKIGISNNPEYREKTLQSEKPTIELLASKKFIRRKIAESIEKALHETYADRRIRGEWFELDQIDVEDIITTLTA
ncbi:MAG: GIY-YIG nuclease family protein [Bacteroidales bacterium]|nr:GIY-YIG nuclease family protein [Bacteroidales bacterium]